MSKKSTKTVNPTATVKPDTNPDDARLDALDGTQTGNKPATPVTHPVGTQYRPADALRVHPDNPRNHVDTIAGVAVPSSVRPEEMADSILRAGDIIKPLIVCGTGCKSKPGTILSGNRRFSGVVLLQRQNLLPVAIATRGIPCDVRDNLTATDENNILNDHGDTQPLNPTECFRAMLAMQANGYGPEEIVFRHPGLLAGFMQKTLPALPTDAKERGKWYDTVRDTLAYNVLCWGHFPASLLPAKILNIQEEKERAFSGKDTAKPVYNPFKPTAQRAKLLYKAMRADRKAGQWDSKTGGPEFNALCEKFRTDDNPATPETATLATSEANPLPQTKVTELRESVGLTIPVADALLTFVQTGNRPENYDAIVNDARFASGLLDVIRKNRARFAKVLPVAVMSAIDDSNGNALADAVATMPE